MVSQHGSAMDKVEALGEMQCSSLGRSRFVDVESLSSSTVGDPRRETQLLVGFVVNSNEGLT